ncbi:nucleoid-associated protein [Pedobacter riviphilus]|uniref:Nucleoid-associated protein n=1 Tax=Pedobacter riviphilus TaxID=2766984 RepID=A0ABX6TPN7_9SPHI|nr:nucleoid-associated protein [Pedobacter riviphilus]QNR86757.1 nucleoid-associated protein [Pedobacter riviphilus]
MQNITLGQINKFIVHFIGNKNNGDGVRFADILTDFDKIEEHIRQLANNSFKFEELYRFFFLPNLDLNPVYQFVSSIFKNKESFIEQSQNAGRYLYDKSTHPQIKSGELCIIYFNDCKINDEIVDCIGIFKSENKETILKVNNKENGFELTDEKGINVNKLDKGCLIFNTGKENGFIISVVDNTNRSSEAQYWKDEFLGIQPIKNDFHQTNQFLGITKQFVTKQLEEDFEVSKADKIDFLNRSVDYFKKHETFDKKEFEEEVFASSNVIESFRKFDQTYRQENEVELLDNFEISAQAVKKQARVFKNILKLDKNFDIYIHGNRQLIEQGIDENGRKYYKIYYEEEA